jgi:hypothetical protein
VQALMVFYTLLTCTPSFWFDPLVLSKYGFGIARLDDRQIEAKIFSNRTIIQAKQTLEQLNLSMFYFHFSFSFSFESSFSLCISS